MQWLRLPLLRGKVMGGRNAGKELMDTVTGISLTVVLPRHDVLEELAARHQVKDEVMEPLLGDAVVEPHDVGVLEQPADPRLALQLLVVSG